MGTISFQEIERNPRAFLRRIEAGESLCLVQGDRTIAEVHPVDEPLDGPRPFGLALGLFTVPPDFDQPLPDDVLRLFEG